MSKTDGPDKNTHTPSGARYYGRPEVIDNICLYPSGNFNQSGQIGAELAIF